VYFRVSGQVSDPVPKPFARPVVSVRAPCLNTYPAPQGKNDIIASSMREPGQTGGVPGFIRLRTLHSDDFWLGGLRAGRWEQFYTEPAKYTEFAYGNGRFSPARSSPNAVYGGPFRHRRRCSL
jgi:hypothetical protein